MKKRILIPMIVIFSLGVFIGIKYHIETKMNVDDIKKSIVTITPEENLVEYNSNPKGVFNEIEGGGVGAGFFISNDGKIVTAKHIVPNKDGIYKITLYSNKTYDARVIYQDPESDIAIVQINTKEKTIPLVITSDIQKGESIISFGADLKTQEIISNHGQIVDINKKGETLSHLIQISTPLKPGYSGGPVINNRGEVVGINYAIYEQANLVVPFNEDLPQYHR